MTIQTISSIKEQITEIKKYLKGFVLKDHADERFGVEKEYTAAMLKDGVVKVLFDLGRLLKAPAQFVVASSHAERMDMLDVLSEMNGHFAKNDHDAVATAWDKLKQLIRPYNVDIDPESVQERMNAVHTDASEKLTTIEESAAEAKRVQQSAQTTDAEIAKLLAQAKSKEDAINSFSARVEKRESQLEKQEQRTDEYKDQLDAYGDQHKEHLIKAEKLIESAKKALGLKTAEGISASFTERYREEKEKSKINFGWLVAAAVFGAGAGVLGYFLLVHLLPNSDNATLAFVTSKIAIVSVLVYAAWFCATQYVRSKNILEDYGYKSVLAQSVVAFLDQFNEPGERERYLIAVLAQIHQDPLRKKHDAVTPLSKIWDMLSKKEKGAEEPKGG